MIMNLARRKTLRLSAFVTGLLFIVSEVSLYGQSIHTVSSFSVEGPISTGSVLMLPSALGSVAETVQGQGPVIFHIQEAHGEGYSQNKIKKILDYLEKQHGVEHVFLEGNAANLHPEFLRFFPDQPQWTREAVEALFQKGHISGPAVHLALNETAAAYPLEQKELYESNLRALKEVLEARESARIFLKSMDLQIKRLSSAYLSPVLRTWLSRLNDYQRHKMTFEAWVRELQSQSARHLKIDLASAKSQADWPMLVRVLALQRMEKQIDRQAFDKERVLFLRAIGRFVSAELVRETTSRLESVLGQAGPAGAQTDLFFEKLIASLPADFDYARYAQVMKVMGYGILQSELEVKELTREMERLQEAVSEKLAVSKKEKHLVRLLEEYHLNQKLFALELVPDDYERLKNKDQDEAMPSGLARRFLEVNDQRRVKDFEFSHLETMDRLFRKAMGFYRLAEDRDAVMLERLEQTMKDGGFQKAAVITGGFHSRPFYEHFLKKGQSYFLITPKMKPAGGRQAYVQSVLKNYQFSSSPARATVRVFDEGLTAVRDFPAGWSFEPSRQAMRSAVSAVLARYQQTPEVRLKEMAFVRDEAGARSELRTFSESENKAALASWTLFEESARRFLDVTPDKTHFEQTEAALESMIALLLKWMPYSDWVVESASEQKSQMDLGLKLIFSLMRWIYLGKDEGRYQRFLFAAKHIQREIIEKRTQQLRKELRLPGEHGFSAKWDIEKLAALEPERLTESVGLLASYLEAALPLFFLWRETVDQVRPDEERPPLRVGYTSDFMLGGRRWHLTSPQPFFPPDHKVFQDLNYFLVLNGLNWLRNLEILLNAESRHQDQAFRARVSDALQHLSEVMKLGQNHPLDPMIHLAEILSDLDSEDDLDSLEQVLNQLDGKLKTLLQAEVPESRQRFLSLLAAGMVNVRRAISRRRSEVRIAAFKNVLLSDTDRIKEIEKTIWSLGQEHYLQDLMPKNHFGEEERRRVNVFNPAGLFIANWPVGDFSTAKGARVNESLLSDLLRDETEAYLKDLIHPELDIDDARVSLSVRTDENGTPWFDIYLQLPEKNEELPDGILGQLQGAEHRPFHEVFFRWYPLLYVGKDMPVDEMDLAAGRLEKVGETNDTASYRQAALQRVGQTAYFIRGALKANEKEEKVAARAAELLGLAREDFLKSEGTNVQQEEPLWQGTDYPDYGMGVLQQYALPMVKMMARLYVRDLEAEAQRRQDGEARSEVRVKEDRLFQPVEGDASIPLAIRYLDLFFQLAEEEVAVENQTGTREFGFDIPRKGTRVSYTPPEGNQVLLLATDFKFPGGDKNHIVMESDYPVWFEWQKGAGVLEAVYIAADKEQREYLKLEILTKKRNRSTLEPFDVLSVLSDFRMQGPLIVETLLKQIPKSTKNSLVLRASVVEAERLGFLSRSEVRDDADQQQDASDSRTGRPEARVSKRMTNEEVQEMARRLGLKSRQKRYVEQREEALQKLYEHYLYGRRQSAEDHFYVMKYFAEKIIGVSFSYEREAWIFEELHRVKEAMRSFRGKTGGDLNQHVSYHIVQKFMTEKSEEILPFADKDLWQRFSALFTRFPADSDYGVSLTDFQVKHLFFKSLSKSKRIELEEAILQYPRMISVEDSAEVKQWMLQRAVWDFSEGGPLSAAEFAAAWIQSGLKRLPYRERESILAYYFWDPAYTLRDLGEMFGVGPERARQILAKAERKLSNVQMNATLIQLEVMNDFLSGNWDDARTKAGDRAAILRQERASQPRAGFTDAEPEEKINKVRKDALLRWVKQRVNDEQRLLIVHVLRQTGADQAAKDLGRGRVQVEVDYLRLTRKFRRWLSLGMLDRFGPRDQVIEELVNYFSKSRLEMLLGVEQIDSALDLLGGDLKMLTELLYQLYPDLLSAKEAERMVASHFKGIESEGYRSRKSPEARDVIQSFSAFVSRLGEKRAERREAVLRRLLRSAYYPLIRLDEEQGHYQGLQILAGEAERMKSNDEISRMLHRVLQSVSDYYHAVREFSPRGFRDYPEEGIYEPLLPAQRYAVWEALQTLEDPKERNAILTSEARIGKTMQAVLAAYNIRLPDKEGYAVKRTLFTTRNQAKFEAAQEISRRTGPDLNLKVIVIDGPRKEKRKQIFRAARETGNVILVANYESVLALQKEIQAFKPDAHIIDEVESLRYGKNTLRAPAVFGIQADYRIAISAKIVVKSIGDLIEPLIWTRGRSLFPGQDAVRIREVMKLWSADQFFDALDPVMVRWRRKVVMPEVGDPKQTVIEIEYGPDQDALIRRIRTHWAAWLKKEARADKKGFSDHIFRRFDLERRAAVNPKLVSAKVTEESPKIKALDEIIEEEFRTNGKVVVLVDFVEEIERLQDRYNGRYGAGSAVGVSSGLSLEERNAAIWSFRSKAQPSILVGTTFMLGSSLNLFQAAGAPFHISKMVLLSRPWRLYDAGERLIGVGQTRSVEVVWLLGKFRKSPDNLVSIEEMQRSMFADEQASFDHAIDGTPVMTQDEKDLFVHEGMARMETLGTFFKRSEVRAAREDRASADALPHASDFRTGRPEVRANADALPHASDFRTGRPEVRASRYENLLDFFAGQEIHEGMNLDGTLFVPTPLRVMPLIFREIQRVLGRPLADGRYLSLGAGLLHDSLYAAAIEKMKVTAIERDASLSGRAQKVLAAAQKQILISGEQIDFLPGKDAFDPSWEEMDAVYFFYTQSAKDREAYRAGFEQNMLKKLGEMKPGSVIAMLFTGSQLMAEQGDYAGLETYFKDQVQVSDERSGLYLRLYQVPASRSEIRLVDETVDFYGAAEADRTLQVSQAGVNAAEAVLTPERWTLARHSTEHLVPLSIREQYGETLFRAAVQVLLLKLEPDANAKRPRLEPGMMAYLRNQMPEFYRILIAPPADVRRLLEDAPSLIPETGFKPEALLPMMTLLAARPDLEYTLVLEGDNTAAEAFRRVLKQTVENSRLKFNPLDLPNFKVVSEVDAAAVRRLAAQALSKNQGATAIVSSRAAVLDSLNAVPNLALVRVRNPLRQREAVLITAAFLDQLVQSRLTRYDEDSLAQQVPFQALLTEIRALQSFLTAA